MSTLALSTAYWKIYSMINEALSGERAILSINYSSILIKQKRKREKQTERQKSGPEIL